MSTAIVLVTLGLALSLLVGSVYLVLYWQAHRAEIRARFKNLLSRLTKISCCRSTKPGSSVQPVSAADLETPAPVFRLSKLPDPDPKPDSSVVQPLPQQPNEDETATTVQASGGNDVLAQEKEAVDRLSLARRRQAAAGEALRAAEAALTRVQSQKEAASIALVAFCEKVAFSVVVEDFVAVTEISDSLSPGELVVVVAGVAEILSIVSPQTDVEVKVLTSAMVGRFAKVAQLPRPVQAQLRSLRRDFQEADYAVLAAADQLGQAEAELGRMEEETRTVEGDIANAARIVEEANTNTLVKRGGNAFLPGPPLPKRRAGEGAPAAEAAAQAAAAAPAAAAPSPVAAPAPPAPVAAATPAPAFPSVEQLREWTSADAQTDPQTGQQAQAPSYRRAAAEPPVAASMEERLRGERERQAEQAQAYAEYFRAQQTKEGGVGAGAGGGVGGPEGFFFGQKERRRRATNTPRVPYEEDMNTLEGKTVYALKKEIVKQLEQELLREESTEAERRTMFKQLSVRHHPDKNRESREVAKRVFQFIQALKDWFLEGLATVPD